MKLYTLIASLLIASSLSAGNPELIVEKVNNQGLVPGNTYRVWLKPAEAGHSLHAIWGDTEHPLIISSTAPFYQHPLGGHSSLGMSESLIQSNPALAYDSYVTIGYERSSGNGLWELGVDFTAFNAGGSITAENGSWFLLPTDSKCQPQPNGLVLIGQFTTSGIASGTLNIQGWEAPQQKWQKIGITFTSEEAQTFGCMDETAGNYNPDATFDDASCSGIANAIPNVTSGNSSWEIFPNPVSESLIHLQFNDTRVFSGDKLRIDIFDMAGKMIASHQLSPANIQSGNRITLNQVLAQGSYKVVISGPGVKDSKTLVVQK